MRDHRWISRGHRIKRREFITLLGGMAGWPLAVRAQQPAMPTIGFLGSGSAEPYAVRLRAFRQGLDEAGFVEGRNVAIEYRFAADQSDRLPGLAAELVRRQTSVIAAGGIPAALAIKAATATVPTVFYVAGDPIKLRLVPRMNHPGGNVTGVTTMGAELSAKRLELARELVPTASAVALLVNPSNPNTEGIIKDAQAAARSLGLQLHVLRAMGERDFDASFATVRQLRAGALVIGNDSLLVGRSEQLAALGLRHAVPTIFQNLEFAAAGGLASYGSNNSDSYRQAGVYAGRILKGEKPGNLPVVQSTKVELIVNLKTAKSLGITVSLPLLGRADQVIE